VKKATYTDNFFFILIIIFSFLLFNFIYKYTPSDIPYHASFISKAINGEIPIPANFLYYLFVYVFAGFEAKYFAFSSAFILSLATAFKFYLTRIFLCNFLKGNTSFGKNKRVWINIIATSMLFAFALPSLTLYSWCLYIGNYPANVWHNSTIIFLMPFALLLFWQSYKLLVEFDRRRSWLVFVLVLLNVLIKPSFIFVILPVFSIVALFKDGLKAIFWRKMLPIFAGACFVVIEYIFIYQLNPIKDESSVAIHPFYVVFHSISKHPIISFIGLIVSLISSYFFPLILSYFDKSFSKDNMVRYAVALLAVGHLIYWLFIETGQRMTDGNFWWQILPCTYIIFTLALAYGIKYIFNEENKKKVKLIIIAYGMHIIAGLIYLVRIFLFKSIA
jgi:hypothetical protein